MVTLRAQGRVGEGLTCRIETGKALVAAGLALFLLTFAVNLGARVIGIHRGEPGGPTPSARLADFLIDPRPGKIDEIGAQELQHEIENDDYPQANR